MTRFKIRLLYKNIFYIENWVVEKRTKGSIAFPYGIKRKIQRLCHEYALEPRFSNETTNERDEEPSRGTNELSRTALRLLRLRVERIPRFSFGKKRSGRKRKEERERGRGRGGEARGGAPVRQLNFSSFGTQLETRRLPHHVRPRRAGPSSPPSCPPTMLYSGGSYGHWSRPSRAERARLPTKADLPNPNLRQRGFALLLPFFPAHPPPLPPSCSPSQSPSPSPSFPPSFHVEIHRTSCPSSSSFSYSLNLP